MKWDKRRVAEDAQKRGEKFEWQIMRQQRCLTTIVSTNMKTANSKSEGNSDIQTLDEACQINSGEHWRYCLQCGHELINEKCKLRCPRCHYFMSCSDFYFAG